MIDEKTDNRRKIGVKRRIESLEQDRDLLMRLLETLRVVDGRQGRDVLTLIQGNAPLDELRLFLAENSRSMNDEWLSA